MSPLCHLHKLVYRPTTRSLSQNQTALAVFTPTDSVTWRSICFLCQYAVAKAIINYGPPHYIGVLLTSLAVYHQNRWWQLSLKARYKADV